MSWVARKLCMSDDIDQKEVIKEYFINKEQERLLQERQLKEFWTEVKEDQDNG